MGGYRRYLHGFIIQCVFIITHRGKDSGHDIDLLISHPDNTVVNGLLEDFVAKLKSKVA